MHEIRFYFFSAACLWVGGPSIEGYLGLPRTLFSSALVAVMAVSSMAVRHLISWEDLKGVSFIFLALLFYVLSIIGFV